MEACAVEFGEAMLRETPLDCVTKPGRIGSQTITWSSDNITGNVRIELSRDGATTWETLVASTANDGSELIRFTGRPTRLARLRIFSLNSPAVSDSSVMSFALR